VSLLEGNGGVQHPALKIMCPYAPQPSPENSCRKRNPQNPIRVVSFVSIVLHLILV